MTWVPKNRSADDASGKSEDEEEASTGPAGTSEAAEVQGSSMVDQSGMYGFNYGLGGK